MKYTEDYPHRPILGKAGEFVDILSRVPADTDIVLDLIPTFLGILLLVHWKFR